MTRVADLTSHQSMLFEFLRAQRDIFETQRQIATGEKARDYASLGDDIGLLVTSKAAMANAEAFRDTATQLQTRLNLQDLQLGAFAESANELRRIITEAVANDSGLVLRDQIDSVVSSASAALNAEIDGAHIFAGTRTDTQPVTISTLAELVAAPTVADVFQNNDVKPAARIDESETIEYGQLASDLATDLFTAIRTIAALGPFSENLTDAQRSALTAEISNLEAIGDAANADHASNGVYFQEVEDAIDRNVRRRDYMAGVISDIQDVDLAEAATRLSQDQAAIEAAAKVLAEMQQMTILDFI